MILCHVRLMKITVQEVGHIRYLPQCSEVRCVMRNAEERIAALAPVRWGFCDRRMERLT